MPRVTKSVTAKQNIRKFLMLQKVIMEQGADYIKLLNNQILNLFNMLLEIEKIEKEISDHYG